MTGDRHRMAVRLAALSLWVGGILVVAALTIWFLPGLDYTGRLAVLALYGVATVGLMAWSARRDEAPSDEEKR